MSKNEPVAKALVDSEGDNVSENIGNVAKAIYRLSDAIAPIMPIGSRCDIPGTNGLASRSVEEAICAVASGLFAISRAIEEHTEEMRQTFNAYVSMKGDDE